MLKRPRRFPPESFHKQHRCLRQGAKQKQSGEGAHKEAWIRVPLFQELSPEDERQGHFHTQFDNLYLSLQ